MPPADAAGIALSHEVVRALSQAQTPDAAREGVLGAVARAVGAALGVLWQLDERTGLLVWAADWAADGDVDELRRLNRRLTFTPGVGVPGAVFATVEPRVVLDVAAEPELPRSGVALEAGLRSIVAVPLVGREGPIGVIELLGRAREEPSADTLAALTLAARQLAEYLGRVRIEERLRATEASSGAIVRAALDCIITMDHRGRVVDMNPAAEATFGYARDDAVGELLSELVIPPGLRNAHQRALAAYLEHGRATILNRRLELRGQRADGTTFPVELTVTRLGEEDPPVFAGFLRDITERREAEDATRRTAEALQRSLLPPHLPAIPGVELSAAYRAGAEGWQVGGDFYDVFELAEGRWGVVIGDVCGKGPEAASTTAIVRYAMRAAAMRHEAPSGALAEVNDALLADERANGFFTAIYATVDVSRPRPRVTMAVGGHPLPLHCSGGAVRRVGRHGTMLGAFPDAATHDCELELGAGDVLLFYTDGVTEARVGAERYGSRRLEATLAALAPAAGDQLANRLDAELLAAADGVSDDVAILALRA